MLKNIPIQTIPEIDGKKDLLNSFTKISTANSNQSSANKIDFSKIKSCASIALHMHQPLIPAGGADLQSAQIISNLQHMMENGDEYNASVFKSCYQRMGEIIPQLIEEGYAPRVMLEYSGTLLYGLQQMAQTIGMEELFGALKKITCDARYQHAVEWLGCTWGHAVAPSTPMQDFRLHLKAWQQHFASIFGLDALARIKGFSPAEMAIPNHPDVAYEFVKALSECGYEWLLVQEHTVENPTTGQGPNYKHIPHLLVCRNSQGESASIVALIKTQGSDTKLVAQMQPWYEAQTLSRYNLREHPTPPIVSQIADGENGGVMMNEFPGKYIETVKLASHSETPLVNASEYLEYLFASGISKSDLPVIQPLHQKALWDKIEPGCGPEKLKNAIAELQKNNHRFHMEGGSWTSNISWVKGYENVLGPMEKISALFDQRISKRALPSNSEKYKQALFYLLCTQTSCFRYWGQGRWTDYAKEFCRRAEEVIIGD